MTRNEELAAVIHLACLTEDRTDREQRALIAIAWRCDQEHNRQTSHNPARRKPSFRMQNLTALVNDSRLHDRDDRVVPMPKGWGARWDRWARDEPSLSRQVAS